MIPPILCYHKIDTRFELGVTRLGPRAFRRQIKALAKSGFTTLGSSSLAMVCAEARRPWHAAVLPPRVVLTFDDGYAALARHAFPVLADHAFRALVFVITDFVGRHNDWDVKYGWRSFAHLDWDALGRWQDAGIEVHSHGVTHRRLTWLSDDEAADELGRSHEVITQRLGRAPAGVCYPFGAADERVRALAARAGYTLGFGGPSAPGGDAMLLRRLPVYAWDVFGPPLVLRDGLVGAAAQAASRAASRFAVVTSALKRSRSRG